MAYNVILKSIKDSEERITLYSGASTKEAAEIQRKQWRRALGNKNWIVDRRPGLDTLDFLALTIIQVK